MKISQRSVYRTMAAALLALTIQAAPAAHDIPDEIVLHSYVKPAQDRLQVLLRIPLLAVTDANLPKDGTGYLAMPYLPPAMREAANILRSLGQKSYELETETFLLAGAGERVLANLARNVGELVMTPVRFNTLSQARDMEAWLKVARTLGDAAKQRIVAEIREIPAEVAATRLADMVMRLSSLFKAVAFEIPVADPGFQAKLPPATRLATMNYRQVPWTSLGRPGPGFEKLARSLDLRQRRLIVRDVPSAGKQTALAKVGVSLFLPPLV